MFQLDSPWILLLLIVPILAWFILKPNQQNPRSALKIPFFHSLQGFMDKKTPSVASFSYGFFYLIWALLVIALARPQWVGEPIPEPREGRNIMLVLDLSTSMQVQDMQIQGRPTTRLMVVKQAARDFVRLRQDDKIGLILFGTKAYLQTPLTFDRQNILERIEDATVGLAGETTSIGDALGLAVKRLKEVPIKSRIVILLTDGANNSGVIMPERAAELAKEEQVKVYTIGLGAQSVQFVMNTPELDEKTLIQIAKLTGGQYFRATDAQSLQRIYHLINQLEKITQEKATVRPTKEYYPWPLAAAFLLLFSYLLFKKHKDYP